jgi:hypothetical protein
MPDVLPAHAGRARFARCGHPDRKPKNIHGMKILFLAFLPPAEIEVIVERGGKPGREIITGKADVRGFKGEMGTRYRLCVNSALLVLVLFAAAGCAAAPEKIRVSVSPFDGAREISLEPALACSMKSARPCSVRMGLYKRSTMLEEGVILIVVVDAPSPIAVGESLYFRVNGQVRGFTSIDRNTKYAIGTGPHTAGRAYCQSPRCSVKRYLVDRAFLKELLAAPEVSMRILLGKGSMGGELSRDDPKLALPSFGEFYASAFGAQ